jgi:putative nuclease YbcO-like protein
MNITTLARDRACEIRVPGECLPTRETVVLCHVRMPDVSGAGFKAPDWLGAFGCARCHDIVDGRAGDWITYPQETRDLMLLEGTARTLVILVNEGVILVPEIQERAPKLRKIVPRRLPA